MTNFKMLIIAIVGSMFCFTVIDYFIIEMSVWQYVIIETIMSIVHSFYNYAKNKQLTNI